MPSPWSACCLRGIAQNSQRIWHHCPGVELRYCYTNTKNRQAKGKCSASKTLFQIICSTYWTFNIKRVILMLIFVLQRTNRTKIFFTRTTHGKVITMIRISCLSCPRHESNYLSGWWTCCQRRRWLSRRSYHSLSSRSYPADRESCTILPTSWR